MKRLWKVLPPCLSDLMGFEAVMNETEGLGIIDDSSRYKPLRSGSDSRERPARANHPESGHPHGRGGHRDGVMPGMRVINSDIRNEDIITGTHNKIMNAFEKGSAQLSPNFALLAYGPSASMIGSDLEYAAEQISLQSQHITTSIPMQKNGQGKSRPVQINSQNESISSPHGLPASYVKIDGEKDYLYGIGYTLEAMGRLLLTPHETIPGTCNILGYNSIDWAIESIRALEELATNAGWRILSRWGIKETTENLKNGAAASVNLVVSEAGLRLARYMEREYGIPYVAGAPFGDANAGELLLKMKPVSRSPLSSAEAISVPAESTTGMIPETANVSKTGTQNPPDVSVPHQSETLSGQDTKPEILIVGEQFMANSIRQELYRRGKTNIRVLSFYDMDKACMLPGDKKLTGEDDFAAQANADTVRVIFADPDLQPLVKKDVRWIKLPNSGSLAPVEPVNVFSLVGNALDIWLDTVELYE